MVTGLSSEDINDGFKAIKQIVGSDQASAIINTGELVPRFCSKLGISFRESRAIQEAVKAAESFEIARSPMSVLAAVICMVSEISQTKKTSIGEIGTVVNVSENTIKKSVKEMYPNYALNIIPTWFAREDEIINNIGAVIRSWV